MLPSIAHINPRSILDIGANVGGFYNEARALWPEARFHLIEGNEACLPYLTQLGQPFHIAYLGAQPERKTFYKRKGGGTDTGNSFYRELTDFFSDDQIEPVEASIQTLDDLLREQTFDLIKIDVQGAELDVLRGGMTVALGAQHIMMEVAIEPYNLDAPLAPEVYEFMDRLRFTKRTEIGDICHPTLRHTVQKDILFSRE